MSQSCCGDTDVLMSQSCYDDSDVLMSQSHDVTDVHYIEVVIATHIQVAPIVVCSTSTAAVDLGPVLPAWSLKAGV